MKFQLNSINKTVINIFNINSCDILKDENDVEYIRINFNKYYTIGKYESTDLLYDDFNKINAMMNKIKINPKLVEYGNKYFNAKKYIESLTEIIKYKNKRIKELTDKLKCVKVI